MLQAQQLQLPIPTVARVGEEGHAVGVRAAAFTCDFLRLLGCNG